MRRTTILLGDELADQLDYERRRRNQSTTAIVREALTEYLAGGKPKQKRLGFIGLGRSGYRNTALRVNEILARDWTVESLTGRSTKRKAAGPRARRRR